MRGQTVFTVTEESAVKGMHEVDVRVYAEREDAVERWNKLVQEWKDVIGDVWEQATGKKGEFEAWLGGYYDEYHVTVYLDEKEVE